MKDDIFQKISRFYYGETAEWNVLIFWYIVVLVLQNGGLIQDGDENIFYFSW
jgi:hypothetical protein